MHFIDLLNFDRCAVHFTISIKSNIYPKVGSHTMPNHHQHYVVDVIHSELQRLGRVESTSSRYRTSIYLPIRTRAVQGAAFMPSVDNVPLRCRLRAILLVGIVVFCPDLHFIPNVVSVTSPDRMSLHQ